MSESVLSSSQYPTSIPLMRIRCAGWVIQHIFPPLFSGGGRTIF